MPHDAGALDAQKRRAAVRVGAHLALEIREPALERQRAQLGDRGLHHDVLERLEQHLGGALDGLQTHVAGEPVANEHVEVGRQHIAPLGVAGEVGQLLAHQLVRLLRELGALLLLLADIEQRGARLLDAQHLLRVDRAHAAELHEVLGLAVGVGAHIAHNDRTHRRGDHRRQRRAGDALGAAHHKRRCRQARAGRAGREEALRGLLLDQAAPDHDRGVLLLAHGLGGMLAHRDGLRGGLRDAAVVGGRERGDDLVGTAQDDGQVLVGGKRLLDAVEHHAGSVVAAQRIDGYGHLLGHGALLSRGNDKKPPCAPSSEERGGWLLNAGESPRAGCYSVSMTSRLR